MNYQFMQSKKCNFVVEQHAAMKYNIKKDSLFDSEFTNTGTDITATWDLAKNAIAVGLSQEKSLTILYEFINQLFTAPELEDEWPIYPFLVQLQPLIEPLFQQSGTKQLIALYVHCLDKVPHKINRLKITITELAFLQSNPGKAVPRVKALINQNVIFLLTNYTKLIPSSTGGGKTTIGADDINKILSTFHIKPKNRDDYKTGFAFALRQCSPADVQYFLDYQEGQYIAEKNFLIFLDSVLTEFHDLFEPKTLKEVEKWLEQKQTILEEAGAEVFSFSKDITKNKEEVLVNIKTFKADHSYTSEIQKILLRKKALKDYYCHKRDRKNLARTTLSLELDQIFLKIEQHEEIMRLIKDRPFDIFPEVISFTEKVNFTFTRDSTIFEPIYRKEKAYLERKNAELLQSLKGNSAAMTSFHQKWIGEPLKSADPDFPFFFVYALRQQKPSRLFHFLDHHLTICERSMETLLAEVCEDYADLPTQGTIDRIKQWTKERASKLSDQKQSLEAKPDPLPDGYKLIDTGLNQEKVKECFAFLHEVKDDNGNSFLSKANYDEVFRYGLAIPTGRISEPTAQLYLDNSKFSLAVVLHFLHKFAKSIEKYKGRSIQSLRSDLALFLYASFKGFYTPYVEKEQPAAIKAIRKRINSQKNPPFRSEKVTFDKYLPV